MSPEPRLTVQIFCDAGSGSIRLARQGTVVSVLRTSDAGVDP